jgi:hypothetical protein
LRTTPARKPRTECCCHPIACAIASTVAPLGACSIAMIRAGLLPVRAVCTQGIGVAHPIRLWTRLELCGFVRSRSRCALRPAVLLLFEGDGVRRFDFAFGIAISFGSAASVTATTEAPPRPSRRRGRMPERVSALGTVSVALCLGEGLSFLDNLIDGLGQSEHLEPLTLNQRVPGSSPGAPTK